MEKNQTMTDEQLARELQNGKRGSGRGKLLTVIGCAATAIGIFTSVTALTVIGIIVGAIAALAVAIVGNVIVTPFYAHMTTAQVVALIVPALLPFNALKFTIHGVITFLIYKPISNLLNR